MDFLETLSEFYSQPQNETQNQTPVGACPNCWGTQEYDGKVRELFKDHQIDVNNKISRHSFIQNFVITHLKGIRLKKGNNGLECPTCKEQ